jgi:hypothetical protein
MEAAIAAVFALRRISIYPKERRAATALFVQKSAAGQFQLVGGISFNFG